MGGIILARATICKFKPNDSLVVHEPMNNILSRKPDATLVVDVLVHPEGRMLQALGELGHHARRRASHGAFDASPVN